DEQARIGHQRAAYGKHLLLTAREPRARIAAPLAQPGEQRIDALERPGRVRRSMAPAGRRDQVFFDAQVRENLPAFRHQADAGTGNTIARAARNVPAIQVYAAGPRLEQ